jgi:cytidine deaminase
MDMYKELDSSDGELIAAAAEAIKKNYRHPQHTVGAAVLGDSGKIYVGVNVESCGYGPCAEPIAVGAAITDGEKSFKKIVAVSGRQAERVVSPCGNCRQLILDYAPDAEVILTHDRRPMKTRIKDLLPDSYGNFFD